MIESNLTLLMAVIFFAHSRQVISKSRLIDRYKSTMSKTTNVRESLSGKLLNHFITLAVFVHLLVLVLFYFFINAVKHLFGGKAEFWFRGVDEPYLRISSEVFFMVF